jgi:hypothetical protein
VFSDAAHVHIVAPVKVNSLAQVQYQIGVNNQPVALGIWWPYGWDGHQWLMTQVGPGTYGHALTIVGYAAAGIIDRDTCFQIDNWHGLLYPVLPPNLAAKVPGYQPIQPTVTSDFWVRASMLSAVFQKGPVEMISATDEEGLTNGRVIPGPGYINIFHV